MDPGVIAVSIPVVAIVAVAAIKIARILASRPEAALPSGDVSTRLEALERDVDGLQQQLTDTQERLDFTERLLTQVRQERRIGG